MTNPLIERCEALLAGGTDNALLRFGLGQAWLDGGDPDRAAEHLASAVSQDPEYSAAYKLLGRACAAAGRDDAARDAWQRGIEVAQRRGDIQAAKEMSVFVRRLDRDRR